MKDAFGNTLVHKVIVACITIIFVVCAGARPSLGIHAEKLLAVGNHLPPLDLTDLSGKSHYFEWNLPQPKAMIIVFFEPRCADCFKEMVFLDHLWRRAKDFGLVVYAVEGSGLTASETQEAMQKYRRFYGEPAFHIIPDPDYALSSLFGIQRLPSSLLIERHGVILGRNDSFDNRIGVDLTRKTERLLGVEKGFFSFALRELEIDAETEANLERSLSLRTALTDRGKEVHPRLTVGNVVPGFEYTDINGLGNEWRPSSEGDGLTIVFFWGALCRSCIQEMAFLDQVYASTEELRLDIIAVEGNGFSAEQTIRVMERYQRFYPLPSYRIVPDPDFRLAELFGIEGVMPQTFFITGTGDLVYHTDEFIIGQEEALTKEIEMALNMESGSLRNKMMLSVERNAPPLRFNEAPSIRAGLQIEEEFRSNLVRGDTYYGNWEFDRALPHYLRCLELEPYHTSIHMKVAKIYERKGRLEKALASWRRALELEPNNAEALSRIKFLSDYDISEEGAI
jgi:peroxiredoxin